MKGMISETGTLKIKRKGEMKNMLCIFNKELCCGDLCPAFHEPDDCSTETGFKIMIDLCREAGALFFDEFEDKRK